MQLYCYSLIYVKQFHLRQLFYEKLKEADHAFMINLLSWLTKDVEHLKTQAYVG